MIDQKPNYFQEGSKTYALTSFLKPWSKNPRSITEENYEKLKYELQGQQFKPLLITQDGTVIAGNMRARVYKDIGKNKVWVSVLTFKSDGELVTTYIDGVKDQVFETEEDAMLYYNFLDNDHKGDYERQMVAENILEAALPLDNFRIHTGKGKLLTEVLSEFAPSEQDLEEVEAEAIKPKRKVYDVICPKCGHKHEIDL